MSKYDEKKFRLDFMERTEEILRGYQGTRNATLLVNCLVGLLIVPKEKYFDRLPDTNLGVPNDWGVSVASIECSCEFGDKHVPTVKQLVKALRHSVAHFDITPTDDGNDVTGFEFKGRGFRAEMTLKEIETFVYRLAAELKT